MHQYGIYDKPNLRVTVEAILYPVRSGIYPPEAQRCKSRSAAEQVKCLFEDHYGGTYIWVQGHRKVASHLMLDIAVMQLLRLMQ